jgi:hypothetical protein
MDVSTVLESLIPAFARIVEAYPAEVGVEPAAI